MVRGTEKKKTTDTNTNRRVKKTLHRKGRDNKLNYIQLNLHTLCSIRSIIIKIPEWDKKWKEYTIMSKCWWKRKQREKFATTFGADNNNIVDYDSVAFVLRKVN